MIFDPATGEIVSVHFRPSAAGRWKTFPFVHDPAIEKISLMRIGADWQSAVLRADVGWTFGDLHQDANEAVRSAVSMSRPYPERKETESWDDLI